VPLDQTAPVGLPRSLKPRQRIRNEPELAVSARPRALSEKTRHRLRRHRKRVVVIAEQEPSAVALQSQFSGLDNQPGMVFKNGEQNLVSQPLLGRVPLDIEIRRVAAGCAVLQSVPPPHVVIPRDGHVVGHDVQQLAQAAAAKFLREPFEPGFTAQLAVHSGIVDHVVSVRAAGSRLQIGGTVDVGDS